MDSFELSLEHLNARQMEFLKNATPDDWHRYAWHHNWDDRLDGLFWIVSQPNCDKATALLIFWKGEPTGYDYETEEEHMGDDIYGVAPMLKYISERFNTLGYTRSEIAYDSLEDHGINMPEYYEMAKTGRQRDIKELIERQKDLADHRVKLHPNMKLLKISGRKVGSYDDDSDFYDQFPDHVDDDGADLNGTVATDALFKRDSPKGEPTADANTRIKAMRHQAGAQIAATSHSRPFLDQICTLCKFD